MSNGFDLSLVAARPALLAGSDNTVDVLIRVQAPDSPKSGLPERPRLNLAIVIDRSGSMDGQPLHEAKRAAGFVIDSLKATDRAAVVTYDDSVQVVAKSRRVENKTYFKNAISPIHSGGARTCTAAGLEVRKRLLGTYLRSPPAACSCSPMARPTPARQISMRSLLNAPSWPTAA
jgi:Mg-chelatase subunit ChlD